MAQANAQHQAQAEDDEQQQGGPMPLQRLEVRHVSNLLFCAETWNLLIFFFFFFFFFFSV
jgi:hypothetical protein